MNHDVEQYIPASQDALDTYAAFVEEHRFHPRKTYDDSLGYLGIALVGEIGETYNIIKKHMRGDKGKDLFNEEIRHALRLELGDILWYFTALAQTLGYDLHEVILSNMEKLKARKAEEGRRNG